MRELEQANKQLSREADSLRSEISDMQAQSDAAMVIGENATSQEEAESLRGEIRTLQSEAKDLQRQLRDTENLLQDAEVRAEKVYGIEHLLEQAKDDLAAATEEADNLRKERDDVESLWSEKIMAVQAESMDAMQSMKQLLTCEKEKWEETEARIQGEKDQAVREMEIKHSQLQQARESIANLKDAVKTWERANETTKKEVNRYHTLLSSQQSQAEEARQKLVETHKREIENTERYYASRMEVAKEQLQKSRARTNELEIKVASVAVDRTHLRATIEQQSRKLEQLSQSQSSMSQSSSRLKGLEAKLGYKEKDCADLKHSLQRTKKELADVTKKLAGLERGKEFEITRLTLSYERQIAILQNELTRARSA